MSASLTEMFSSTKPGSVSSGIVMFDGVSASKIGGLSFTSIKDTLSVVFELSPKGEPARSVTTIVSRYEDRVARCRVPTTETSRNSSHVE